MGSTLRTIYRYELPITDRPSIMMPTGAEILSHPPSPRNSAKLVIELWAPVDKGALLEARYFRIVGTGNPVPDDCQEFIGTVTLDGRGVWHVFTAITP